MKSNDLLLIGSAILIFFSLFNIFFVFSGKATDSGILNITISTSVRLNFTTDFVDFGSGAVDLGKQNATIDTMGNVVNGNWTAPTSGFIVENLGNSNLSLSLKSGKTASGFLGGTSPDYDFNVTNSEAGSCINSTGFDLGQWYNVNTTDPGTSICSFLFYNDSKDEIRIDLRLVVPSDANTGQQTDTFTAIATAV